jgi:hypothetical protein
LFFGISWGLIGSFDGAPRRPFGGLLNGQFSSRTLPYGGGYWLGDVGGDDSLDSAVNVNGIDAVVGIATPTTNPGGFLIYVSDSPGFEPDTLELVPVSTPPQVCPAPVRPNMAIFVGSITVIDAPPVLISKEQCKNGGWRNFPQFKSQGQCIAFVSHGP